MNRGKKHERTEGMSLDKAEDFKLAWSKLFGYIDRYRIPFIVALVFSAVGTIMSLVTPDILKQITDLITVGLTGTMDLDSIASIGVTLIVIVAIGCVLMFLETYILATVTQRTASNLRRDISRKINRLPLGYFDSTTTGDVMSRVTNDVDTIGQAMNQSITTLVSAVTMLIGSSIMMAITNVPMMVTAILSSLAGFALIAIIMSRSQKYFAIQQRDLGAMNGHVEEIYTGHLVVKAYGGEVNAKKRFDEINDSLFSSAFRSQFLSGLMMPLMNFIGNFGYVMVCIVGAVLVLSGDISIGVIVAFMLYVRLFTQPLSQISQAVVYMQSTAAASERVFAFLEANEMEDESSKTAVLTDVKGHVEFKDVRFGYLPDKEIVHGFSANIEPGQKVAIVGPTGAGKTTIVNLLMRFYEVNSGDILIDGVSTKDITRSNVHDLFCMVLQDTWLFEGTMRENIVYSKPDVSDERLDEVCRAVGLKHFIETLPEGYDTNIGDGSSLSVGQRQQVTIARAMIENAPLLILDEATSSVDTRTEKAIQDAMDKLTEGRTSFVIAHRLSTIRNADLILVMKDGNIIEQGTHDGLLSKGGFYSDLYNSQFDNDAE
ncbi:ABC transporter ATP-binding protein [Candidatus Methanoprimaticola sp. MG2]|uniref:ABC transporter ATP-binding protein n=1 Tax=Candidatus Methanoprimaticola sp. MG2 TaxID=3228838 RepID=UPI0039C5B315